MKEIQEWLGHSTYTTTADIYSHLKYTSKLNVADAIKQMESLFNCASIIM